MYKTNMNTLTSPLLQFIHDHDKQPVFQAGYLVLAFLAAALLNIGFFAILIGIHIFIDVLKYSGKYRMSSASAWRSAFIESLFDICLLCIALTLTVYLQYVHGAFDITSNARSALSLVSLIIILGPKFRIFKDVTHTPAITNPLSLGSTQKILLLIIVVCLVALMFTPMLFSGHAEDLSFVLMRSLVPWKL